MLYVSGEIGAAAVGLAILKEEPGPWDAVPRQTRDALVGRYRIPAPRVELANAIREWASAAMDISDGLVGDCDKLATASGCSASIDAGRVPLPGGLGRVEEGMLARLLTAGDDYEILAAIAPQNEAAFLDAVSAAGVSVARIGTLREGREATEVLAEGRALPLYRRAYTHRGGETSS
jgi:thiamine-monophosphate kinase